MRFTTFSEYTQRRTKNMTKEPAIPIPDPLGSNKSPLQKWEKNLKIAQAVGLSMSRKQNNRLT